MDILIKLNGIGNNLGLTPIKIKYHVSAYGSNANVLRQSSLTPTTSAEVITGIETYYQ